MGAPVLASVSVSSLSSVALNQGRCLPCAVVVWPLGTASASRLEAEILASSARWRVAAEHSIMQNSELRAFIVRAEA
eukprot:1693179-Prymnesium_polylepis.1